MKHASLISMLLAVAALAGCTLMQSGSSASTTHEFPDNCATLEEEYKGVALMVAESRCESLSDMTLAAEARIQDGVFHSTDGAVTVSLPELQIVDGHPTAQVWEDYPSKVNKIYIAPTPDDGLQYSIYPLYWAVFAAPKSLDELDDRFLHNINFTAQMMIGGAHQQHLYAARTVLADGSPAILEVFRPAPVPDVLNPSDTPPAPDARPYLIYYLIKSGDAYSILSVFWSKPCEVCATGPESAIRNLDPHIEAFVDSYRLSLPAN